MRNVLRTLLSELIDYAGLFPPASLSMKQAVANYAGYFAGEDRYALGRFIVPVERLAEFDAEARPHYGPEPWRISALLSDASSGELKRLEEWNAQAGGAALIDAVELKAASPSVITATASSIPDDLVAFYEIDGDPASFAAIAATRHYAKIRTGGVTPEAFPTAPAIVKFLVAARQTDVAFKATAGLHHPLRCERALTYEPESARGAMHGFFNLFLAAAFIDHGAPEEEMVALLMEQEPSAFQISDDEIVWRDLSVSSGELGATRSQFAIAFGACSFEEPLTELRQLGWI